MRQSSESLVGRNCGFSGQCNLGATEICVELLWEMRNAARSYPCGIYFELPGQDLNLDKESQNLLCYRYTTG